MTEKRLTFSQDVITQQNDKENVSDLASCLERTIVSPNTYLARAVRRSTARRR